MLLQTCEVRSSGQVVRELRMMHNGGAGLWGLQI